MWQQKSGSQVWQHEDSKIVYRHVKTQKRSSNSRSTSSQETTVGPSHWANARPRFLASSRSSCLERNNKPVCECGAETAEKFRGPDVTSSSSGGPSQPVCPVFPESWCRRRPSQSLKHRKGAFVYTSVYMDISTSMSPSVMYLVCSGPVNAGRGSLPIVCSIRPPFSFFPNNRPIDDLMPFFCFLERVKTRNDANSTNLQQQHQVWKLHACVCMCAQLRAYPRPSSRLPVNWAKLVSRCKLRGDDGGDVSHLMVALSISTGD